MDDRIAEIREALANPGRFAMAPAVIWRAAKEYADLLDSDALIIRRDKAHMAAALRLADLAGIQEDGHSLNAPTLWSLVDALASSQGVEP